MKLKLTDRHKQLIDKYGHLLVNTGGNDIVELIERKGVTYFNNVVVAELQGCCWSQVLLLERLSSQGLLAEDPHEAAESKARKT